MNGKVVQHETLIAKRRFPATAEKAGIVRGSGDGYRLSSDFWERR